MDTKAKDAPKTKDALRQLQADVRQLQAELLALTRARESAEPEAAAPKGDWAVRVFVNDGGAKAGSRKVNALTVSDAQLKRASDEAAATLGSAISSPQKVALLRVLLASAEGETASVLGEAASLSTGSLYHHLHDLVHAGLVGQSGRNRYVLTEQGRRVLLVVLALTTVS